MKMRVCTRCGEEKPETTEYFNRAKSCRGGICTICKECISKANRRWYAENSEKAREANKRWQAKNPEKVRERQKRWRANNPEKAREANKRWQAKNPEKVREAVRRWQAENIEKERERQKRWRAENPEKAREKDRRWKDGNPEKVRKQKKRAAKRQVDTLAPTYLKHLITIKYNIDRSEIGDELIEAKRREMEYYRQLNQLKK